METNSKLRIVLTGATGMVGEGVLHEALNSDYVEKVLAINRKPCGIVHEKLTEILHTNFFDLAPIAEDLEDYNTCFFCLGVSSVGMGETEYYRMTYTLTMHMAEFLSRHNSDMVFCYISGAGTDSSEKGRIMWARVKGKTENDLGSLPFKRVYNFRPAMLEPTKGLKNTLKFYKWIGWMMPVMKKFAPAYFCTLRELAHAMINVSAKGYPKQILEVNDIKAAAHTNAPSVHLNS